MAKARSAEKNAVQREANPSVSAEERQHMIAEAAYFRAQQRGFRGGDPMDDWLAAEREINEVLPSAQQQKEEAIVYEKLRKTVKSMLADVQGAVNADTVRQTFDKATEELKRTGAHTADTIGKIAATLRKDIASAAEKMGPRWEAFSQRPADLFEAWRDRGSLFLAQAATAVGDWLQQTGTKRGQQTYRAGEMVFRGTFECTACGEQVVLSTSGHLPPCSRCQKLEYRRV